MRSRRDHGKKDQAVAGRSFHTLPSRREESRCKKSILLTERGSRPCDVCGRTPMAPRIRGLFHAGLPEGHKSTLRGGKKTPSTSPNGGRVEGGEETATVPLSLLIERPFSVFHDDGNIATLFDSHVVGCAVGVYGVYADKVLDAFNGILNLFPDLCKIPILGRV